MCNNDGLNKPFGSYDSSVSIFMPAIVVFFERKPAIVVQGKLIKFVLLDYQALIADWGLRATRAGYLASGWRPSASNSRVDVAAA